VRITRTQCLAVPLDFCRDPGRSEFKEDINPYAALGTFWLYFSTVEGSEDMSSFTVYGHIPLQKLSKKSTSPSDFTPTTCPPSITISSTGLFSMYVPP